MKKIYLIALALVCLSAQSLLSQEIWTWPLKGSETGHGIINRPNSYVGKEHNFNNLYITAAEGTEIISPVDGTITDVGVWYLYDMNRCIGTRCESSFDETIKELIGEHPELDPKYVSGTVSISVSNGVKLDISGLKGTHTFKTGLKIKKGDFLGYMSYSYKGFEEPTIGISVSKNSKSADPMTPFGLKTTYIPPKEIKPITQISETQAFEDFRIFADAVEECYPTLYHRFTPAEFDSLKTWVKNKIVEISPDTTISYDNFRELILACFSQINDSHIYLFPTLWEKEFPDYQPGVWVGLIDDSIRITNVNPKYKDLFGKTVIRANGLDADSAKKVSMKRIYLYDADVRSFPEYSMAFNSLSVFSKKTYDLDLEFADGTSMFIPSIKYNQLRLKHQFMFRMINYYRGKNYGAEMLNDTTAYLGLNNFALNRVEMDEIKTFMDSVSKANVPNMIVDVRNNNGGNDDILQEIWSWFAQDTLKLNGYRRINKVSDFKSFEYSDNYAGLEGEIFHGYAKIEGIDGMCDTTFKQIYYPDPNVNYRGKLYVLTNELSISAATLFPALVVRSHRGVTVGRETCSAYHYLTALNSVTIILPNSKVIFCLPLVEDVFDTQINGRVPYGRGVLPDYEVPISFEEITGDEDADIIKDRALELIAANQYIDYEDPFVTEQEETTDYMYLLYILLGAIAVIVIICLIFRKKKKATSSQKHS